MVKSILLDKKNEMEQSKKEKQASANKEYREKNKEKLRINKINNKKKKLRFIQEIAEYHYLAQQSDGSTLSPACYTWLIEYGTRAADTLKQEETNPFGKDESDKESVEASENQGSDPRDN